MTDQQNIGAIWPYLKFHTREALLRAVNYNRVEIIDASKLPFISTEEAAPSIAIYIQAIKEDCFVLLYFKYWNHSTMGTEINGWALRKKRDKEVVNLRIVQQLLKEHIH